MSSGGSSRKRDRRSLAETHPELAAEALFDPTTVVAGSHKNLPWRCSLGHEYAAQVGSRSRRRTGCPVCNNKVVHPGFNDLATTHPELAAEALFDPTTVVAGSHKKLPWRCSHGHEWVAEVKSRCLSGKACPVCDNKVVHPGYNDLATTHPELAAEALFDPTAYTAGSNKKLPWRCHLGHEWIAQPNSRSGEGRGCAVCSGNAVLAGFNDLATTHPELAAEALFDPTTVVAGSHKKLPWRCSHGHEWTAVVKERALGSTRCPYCSGNVVLPGFNDLATTHPHIAAEALFDATTVTAGSHRKVPWRCDEGHKWKATVKDRALAGNGCPSCATSGFDPASPGWVYLMEHPEWGLLQIGITNDINRRLKHHERNGWQALDSRGPMPGDAARGWEVAILQLLIGQGVALTPSSSNVMPSRSSSSKPGVIGEAWWAVDYPVAQLGPLMEAVRAAEWEP